MRHTRLLVLGTGAALLPFAVVAFFTWARTGVPATASVLLGHGELAPATALLTAQTIAISYGVPMPFRTDRWIFTVASSWLLLALATVSLVVPYAGRAGYERRGAAATAVTFAIGVAGRAFAIAYEWKEPDR